LLIIVNNVDRYCMVNNTQSWFGH